MALSISAELLLYRAFLPLRVRFERWAIGRARRVGAGGLDVRVAEDVPTPEAVARRLAAALDLIAGLDPRRWRRLRRDLRHLLVAQTQTQYWHATRTCVLDLRAVRQSSSALLACSVVHEATHARIGWRVGRRPRWRARSEARCVREELAFAERLPAERYPGKAPFLAHLGERLRAYQEDSRGRRRKPNSAMHLAKRADLPTLT